MEVCIYFNVSKQNIHISLVGEKAYNARSYCTSASDLEWERSSDWLTSAQCSETRYEVPDMMLGPGKDTDNWIIRISYAILNCRWFAKAFCWHFKHFL